MENINFEKGKAIVKKGRKIIAKVYDRIVYYRENNIKTTFSEKYPYSLEMSAGFVECESLEEVMKLIEKYS